VATNDRPISRFAQGATTVTELLRRQGYATAGIVASQLVKHGGGFDQGFDTYDEQPVARFDRPECSADITSRGISWLKRHRDRRFFLYLHYMDPHEPYNPPPQYARKTIPPATPPPTRDIIREGMMVKTRLALMNEPGFHLSKEDVAWLHDLYRAETAYVDHELSVLVSGLRKLGLRQNTIVVVLSDHGEEFMEHGWLDHGWSLYDEVLRVPVIIWGPRIPARKVEAPVSLLDIAPTILDAAGIKRPRDMRGRSLLAARRGAGQALFSDLVGWRDPWPGPHGIPRQAILIGDTKLIHNLGATAPEFELYDLRRDPAERNNLAGTAAQAAPGADFERLRAKLAAVNENLREPPAEAEPSGPPMDDESRERLKSLGYIQ
jgi:arylsulfatase A-like enzyme